MKSWSKAAVKTVMVLFIAGVFSACRSGQEAFSKPVWILEKSLCTVTADGTELKGKYTHSLEGISLFETEHPKELSGLTVRHMQGQYTVQIAGLSEKFREAAMQNSIFAKLFWAIDKASAAELEWDGRQWKGKFSTGETVAVETYPDGTLRAVTVPAKHLTVKFPCAKK